MHKSNSNVKFAGQKNNILSNSCTVCGGSLVKNRVTFKPTIQNSKHLLNNNAVYYSNNRKITEKSSKHSTCDLNYLQKRKIESIEDVPINLITATGHVKHNNICVKYVTTTLPAKQKFRINKKCINSIKQKIISFTYSLLPQKYKQRISKKGKAPKFDGCRPLIVSLECKCSRQEKMHITNSLQSHALFDNNVLFPRCICEKVFDRNQDHQLKKNSHGENLCSNGCIASSIANNSDQNKNSIHFLLRSR